MNQNSKINQKPSAPRWQRNPIYTQNELSIGDTVQQALQAPQMTQQQLAQLRQAQAYELEKQRAGYDALDITKVDRKTKGISAIDKVIRQLVKTERALLTQQAFRARIMNSKLTKDDLPIESPFGKLPMLYRIYKKLFEHYRGVQDTFHYAEREVAIKPALDIVHNELTNFFLNKDLIADIDPEEIKRLRQPPHVQVWFQSRRLLRRSESMIIGFLSWIAYSRKSLTHQLGEELYEIYHEKLFDYFITRNPQIHIHDFLLMHKKIFEDIYDNAMFRPLLKKKYKTPKVLSPEQRHIKPSSSLSEIMLDPLPGAKPMDIAYRIAKLKDTQRMAGERMRISEQELRSMRTSPIPWRGQEEKSTVYFKVLQEIARDKTLSIATADDLIKQLASRLEHFNIEKVRKTLFPTYLDIKKSFEAREQRKKKQTSRSEQRTFLATYARLNKDHYIKLPFEILDAALDAAFSRDDEITGQQWLDFLSSSKHMEKQLGKEFIQEFIKYFPMINGRRHGAVFQYINKKVLEKFYDSNELSFKRLYTKIRKLQAQTQASVSMLPPTSAVSGGGGGARSDQYSDFLL